MGRQRSRTKKASRQTSSVSSLQARPSRSRSSHPTALRTSRQRSRTKKASRQASSLKTAELCRTTTSRRNPHSTSSSDFVAATQKKNHVANHQYIDNNGQVYLANHRQRN